MNYNDININCNAIYLCKCNSICFIEQKRHNRGK